MVEAYVASKTVFFGRGLGIQNVILEGGVWEIVNIFQPEDQL
jgi:hypothetical protein